MLKKARDGVEEPLLGVGDSEASSSSNIWAQQNTSGNDVFESVELRARGGKSSNGVPRRNYRDDSGESVSSNDQTIIERKLSKDDTLQKLSLRYSVKVGELIRTKNLTSLTST